MATRNWIEDKFKGTSEGTAAYYRWKEYFMFEIGNKEATSVLERDITFLEGEGRDNIKYEALKVKEELSAEDYKIMEIIEKRRELKIKKQDEENSKARIIIGVIRSVCGEEPINIVDMHNKDNSKTPLQRVKIILESFETQYKGSTFKARKEFDKRMVDIKVAEERDELPKVVQKMEEIRIQVQSLYPMNTLDSNAVRGYSDEELIHYLLERISDSSSDLTAIRESVSKFQRNGKSWDKVKTFITNEIRDTVKSIKNSQSRNSENIETQNLVLQVKTQQQQQYQNRNVCFRIKNDGQCRWGENCRFSHDDLEIKKARELDRKSVKNVGYSERNHNRQSNSRDSDQNYRKRERSERSQSPSSGRDGGYSKESRDFERKYNYRSPSGSPVRDRSGKKQAGTPVSHK